VFIFLKGADFMLFKKKNNDFAQLVRINDLPILILDETFNYVFKNAKTEKMTALEEEIRELLKEQGELNSEYEKLSKTKKIRLSKILNLSGELQEDASEVIKKMGTNQDLVEHINSKLDAIRKRLDEIPFAIREKNYNLFSEAVKLSYNNVSKLSLKIKKIEPDIARLKEKLRQRLDEKEALDSEYKEKSLFLRTFIGHEGIQILDDEFGGVIK